MALTESQKNEFRAIRAALDGLVVRIADSPAEVNANMAAVRPWKPGAYAVGDVRMYGGNPYKCVQAHDSTANAGWTPDATPALWMQYHGTTKDTARPWVAPSGAHDMYKSGEWMIWTDGTAYKCTVDTVYTPTDYPAAWSTEE